MIIKLVSVKIINWVSETNEKRTKMNEELIQAKNCVTRDCNQTNHHKHIRFESESFSKDAHQFIGKSYANEMATF